MKLPHACEQMRVVLETDESALEFDSASGEYSIAYISDDSVETIEWCPFCGAPLTDGGPVDVAIGVGGGRVPPEVREAILAGERGDARRRVRGLDLPHACESMRRVLDTAESALEYRASVREYAIAYTSDGSVQPIQWCPFCGLELPASLRDKWLARLEELGLDPFSDALPSELRDDRWWRD